jgi:sulfite exporter TauE/SafE
MLGRLAGLASGARVFAGSAMIVAGILMVGFVPSNGLITIQNRGITKRFSQFIGKRLLAPKGKFTLGLTLGFLPCGLVYAALLKAVDSGSALAGAGTMLAFGAGTAVALLSLGAASSFVRLPRWNNRLAAVSMMLAGAVLVWRGLMVPVCHG